MSPIRLGENGYYQFVCLQGDHPAQLVAHWSDRALCACREHLDAVRFFYDHDNPDDQDGLWIEPLGQELGHVDLGREGVVWCADCDDGETYPCPREPRKEF